VTVAIARIGIAVAAVASFVLFADGNALAVPAPPPPREAIAALPNGAVWFDGNHVRLAGASGAIRTIRSLPANDFGPYEVQAAERTVAVLAGNDLLAGELPGPIRKVPVGGNGCWRAAPASLTTFFTVAPGSLLLDGSWSCSFASASGPQPVFVRSIKGGSWRVLRTAPGAAPPILAAHGDVVAIGTQRSLERMSVVLLHLGTGREIARFAMPDGYLAFAGSDRLLLTVPESASFPLEPRVDVAGSEIGGNAAGGGYSLALYSVRGRFLASLGATSELPIVSGSHLVTVDDNEDGTQTISVRSLGSGVATPVIGFDAQGRALLTAALRWPRLVIVQTTSAPLPDGQFNCRFGTYGPPSAPFIDTIDLAHPIQYLPPPPQPPQPPPDRVRARCGPPKP
jgi:hypothetical protein